MPGKAEADPEGLLQMAYSMKYNPKKMKKLEKEYHVIKSKEQEEMTELKVSQQLTCNFCNLKCQNVNSDYGQKTNNYVTDAKCWKKKAKLWQIV